jgi:methylated-DNA-[protein]-cysteine S-methyltransferase
MSNGSRPDPEEAPDRTERALREAIAALEAPPIDFTAVAARVSTEADREGLVEVAWARADSPIGELLVAATDEGLVRVGWTDDDYDWMLNGLAEAIGPRVVEAPARLDPVRRQLDEYFAGERRHFDLELDWRLSHGFTRKVLTACAAIPFGETRSYAEMATAAGSPRAFRAAGSALGSNPIPVVVPCHRVLRSGGALGGYGGGLPAKRTLLELEGVLG